MAPEIGYFALLLALFLPSMVASVRLIAMSRDDPGIVLFGDQAAAVKLMPVTPGSACVTCAFVTSDFLVEVAAADSPTRTGPFRSQPPRRRDDALLDQRSPS